MSIEFITFGINNILLVYLSHWFSHNGDRKLSRIIVFKYSSNGVNSGKYENCCDGTKHDDEASEWPRQDVCTFSPRVDQKNRLESETESYITYNSGDCPSHGRH